VYILGVSEDKPKPVQAQAIKARTAKFKLRQAGQARFASPSDKSGHTSRPVQQLGWPRCILITDYFFGYLMRDKNRECLARMVYHVYISAIISKNFFSAWL
jgi:hypothetical protein